MMTVKTREGKNGEFMHNVKVKLLSEFTKLCVPLVSKMLLATQAKRAPQDV